MRALAPAWPPNARQSSTITRKPSEAAYTAVASPAGPAPTTATSYSSSWSAESSMPRQRASVDSEGFSSVEPFGQTTSTSGVAPPLCCGTGVDGVVRVPVAAQEILDSQQVDRLPFADQHRPARPGLNQTDPAQNQRAHDPLAQIRLGDD